MNSLSTFAVVAAFLAVARWAAQLGLERLNRRHVLGHADAVPEVFKGVVDKPTYAKSVQYTLAKGRLDQVEISWDTGVLLLVLFSGVLAWALGGFVQWLCGSPWVMAAFLLLAGVALSLPGLPLDWYDQFHLEERFGFNTTTQKLWWMDRLKAACLLDGRSGRTLGPRRHFDHYELVRLVAMLRPLLRAAGCEAEVS